jgi:adenine-specific DNA-methyltransferase
MNYIGSKIRLSEFIVQSVKDTVGNTSDKVFCDLFAGTGCIGRAFKPITRKVISNDLEYYSYVLNKNYIENVGYIGDTDDYIRKLNDVEPIKGFIYNNYCFGGSGRLYFSDDNGMKIDAMRQKIESWYVDDGLSDNLYYFLLTCLLESADKVANTASVYGAYLKKLKKSALKQLIIAPVEYGDGGMDNKVFNMDGNHLTKEIEGDILYLDPPYNTRQYGSNYHLLNTIALYDEFVPKGKTGLRDYNRSNYCSKSKVLKSFNDLLSNSKFNYIFLSYNNEGLMSVEEIRETMEKYGKYELVSTEYQRFRSDKEESRKYISNRTMEYLHILTKGEEN